MAQTNADQDWEESEHDDFLAAFQDDSGDETPTPVRNINFAPQMSVSRATSFSHMEKQPSFAQV